MAMNRYKPVGWRNESYRHYLASKGIMTSGADIMLKSNMIGRSMDLKGVTERGMDITPKAAHEGSEVLPRAFKAGESDSLLPGSFKLGEKYFTGSHESAKKYSAKKCPQCRGSGNLYYEPCSFCGGSGEVPVRQVKEQDEYYAGKGDMVSFSPEEAQAFKRRYEQAVANGEEQFTWQGRPVLTSYAKYMVEYMKMRGYNASKDDLARAQRLELDMENKQWDDTVPKSVRQKWYEDREEKIKELRK